MIEHCKTCRFFHELKKFSNNNWEYNTVCTLFPETETGFDAFALIVEENDMCEAWTPLKEQDN